MAANDIVIFGTGQIAEVAEFYFTYDSDYNVVAFTVDSEFITEDQYLGRPIVPFEEVTQRYPAAEYGMFIAVSYSGLNALRAAKFDAAKGTLPAPRKNTTGDFFAVKRRASPNLPSPFARATSPLSGSPGFASFRCLSDGAQCSLGSPEARGASVPPSNEA